jgi:rhodanese-related sulfurtransferase
MQFKQITPSEAKDLLDKGDGYVYVDVRSELEFQKGRPAEAYNIPIKNFNTAIQMMEDNPDFLDVFETKFSKEAKLIVGCAAGTRSFVACQILEQAGYRDLATVEGGFNGKRDMFGNVVQKGWAELGFPVANGDAAEKSYETLKG